VVRRHGLTVTGTEEMLQTCIPRVIGFAGWSGAGKTTLITRLMPLLTARGLSVSTIKQAHHDFDIDKPGKDSYEHRRAGAHEVLVASEPENLSPGPGARRCFG
jgi:molybdopterin-guanine dinucleotide biosynthesis protein